MRLLVTLALGIQLCVAGLAHGQNLVTNGTFDTDATGWACVDCDDNFCCWMDIIGCDGTTGCYFVNGTPLQHPSEARQLVSGLSANQQYVVGGCYRRQTEKWGDPQFQVLIDDTIYFQAGGSSADGWLAFSFTFTADDTDALLRFQTQMNGGDDAYFIDDISMSAVAPAAPTTTVITHGFTPDCNVPQPVEWLELMGHAIVDRAGVGAVFSYLPEAGTWQLVYGDPNQASENTVLVFNWVAESDTGPCGPVGPNWRFTQAAGDALYAALRWPLFVDGSGSSILNGVEVLLDRTIHFIGHSRGACVNSETVRRLGLVVTQAWPNGIPVDQVTMLDPHPVNGLTGGCPPNCAADWGDSNQIRWFNVTYADTHWRQDGACDIKCDFDGFYLTDAQSFPLVESTLSGDGYFLEHSDVHLWYHGTIDTEGEACDGSECVTKVMRQTWYENGGIGQGYHYSALGGGVSDRAIQLPGVVPSPVAVLFNGDFEAESDSSSPTVAGWLYHGGGWDGTLGTPPIAGFGSNTYAFLGQAGSQQATLLRHNRFFLPADASTLGFWYEIIQTDPTDKMVVYLTGVEPGSVPVEVTEILLDSVDQQFLTLVIPAEAIRERTYTLTFELESGLASTADVWLDDIEITDTTVDNIHLVPSEFSTIQAAIDAAVNGDEVLVAPGTYSELLIIPNKTITIRSTSGPAFTTIDGQGLGTVVTCTSGAGPNLLLTGFTITGGSGTDGGGMQNSASNPTIEDCWFVANNATYGGGIFNAGGASPQVSDCLFDVNSANLQGGAIYNTASSPVVSNCVFDLNTAGQDGGGISNYNSSAPEIRDCTFSANSAPDAGAIENRNSQPIVADCTFVANTANPGGGNDVAGAILNDASDTVVQGCVFDANIAGDRGGAIGNQNGGNIQIIACTFTNNAALDDQGGGVHNNANTVPTITDSFFCENTPDHIAPPNTFLDGGGNVFWDICNPDPGDVNGDGLVDVEDLLDLLAAWGPCPASATVCPADVDGNGQVNVVDLLTLLANWST